eukprot:CAMPEP_0171120024 /NCGR_PEP_ID=MMETSP0766_2-20121228/98641_1 /TAXON_ID=439317 /ORGANISM="Gambierdiscus australes, Strain CAWD 149" /LENGTH=53 /DNA_ID=CAMNT_0011582721 /DNA_START=73 /DNA_END=231 /DNA_ORIENTATION=+
MAQWHSDDNGDSRNCNGPGGHMPRVLKQSAPLFVPSRGGGSRPPIGSVCGGGG